MSDRLTAAQIAEIEARAMAATPGEWRIRDGEGLWWTVEAELPSINGLPCWYALARFDFDRAADGYTDGALRPKDDAALLLHARTDIPALVRDLRAAREALEQCARQFEWYAASHAAKGAGEKAERNAKFAAIARAALPEETPNG